MTTRRKTFVLAAALGMCLMLTPSIPPVQAGERIVIGPQFLLPGMVLHVDDSYPRYRRVPPGPPYYYHHGPSPYYYSDYRRPYPPPGSYYHYNDRPRHYRDRYGNYPPPGSYRERLRERDRHYYPDDDWRYRNPPPRMQERRYRTDSYKEERKSLQERRWSR